MELQLSNEVRDDLASEAPEPSEPEALELEELEMEVLEPWQGGFWAVTGNLDRTGFNLFTDTESVLELIWRKNTLETEKPPGTDGPLGDRGGLKESSLTKTWVDQSKLGGT